MSRTAFTALVAAYGAAPARWPQSKRAAAEALLECDPTAHCILREAQALDRVLAAAPLLSDGRDASLADRIVRAAQHTPRLVVQQNAPVLMANADSAAVPQSHRLHSGLHRSRAWQSAAVLAASLVMGVFVGQTEVSGRALPALVEMAGLSLDQPGVDSSHADHWDED